MIEAVFYVFGLLGTLFVGVLLGVGASKQHRANLCMIVDNVIFTVETIKAHSGDGRVPPDPILSVLRDARARL